MPALVLAGLAWLLVLGATPGASVPADPCAGSAGATTRSAALSFVRGASIFLISLDGRRVSLVLGGTGTDDFLPGQIWYFDPTWSANGRCLALTAEEATESHGYDDVYVRPPNGKLVQVQGGGSSISGSPSWAPDGRRLALVGYQSGDGGGIYVRNLRSGTGNVVTPESLDPDSPVDDRPAWSPDGSRIAFSRAEGGTSSIYTVRPDGTDLKLLTAGSNPSWSPDGKRIAFDVRGRIAVVQVSGTTIRYLTLSGDDTDPSWSPDGRTIAFVREPAGKRGEQDVWLVSPAPGKARLFVRSASQPAWKPK